MGLERIKDWTKSKYGIDLYAYNAGQLERRISSLMQMLGVACEEDYIKILERREEEQKRFLDKITINVSNFYRNREAFGQLEALMEKELLPSKKRLKIWSAACSNGAEPYTVAMILDRLTPKVRHSILATDIDTKILGTAVAGIYKEEDLKYVSEEEKKRYFILRDGKYHLDEKIKGMVQFRRHDLIGEPFEKGFDLILCRNVMIYFTPETKRKLYDAFYQSLNVNGLFFIGASEMIYNYREIGFEKRANLIYQKVKA
jgi:chemotaxis protein methyltransferase CheR